MDSTDIPNTSSPPPFDSQAIYQTQLQWLLYLMKQPGWRAYAWDCAKNLSKKDTSGLFVGLDQELLTLYKQHENRTQFSNERSVSEQSQGQALGSVVQPQNKGEARRLPTHQAGKKQIQVGMERGRHGNSFDF